MRYHPVKPYKKCFSKLKSHQCNINVFPLCSLKALMIKKNPAMIGNINNNETPPAKISCQRRSMQIKRHFAGYTCYLTLLHSLP